MLMVRSEYPHAMHRALLASCGLEGARAFWQQNPLVIDGLPLSPSAIARQIEVPGGMSPLDWVLRSQNALEDFLLPYGTGIETFADSLLGHANRASFVPSRTGLSWISPLIGLVFRLADPYRALIKIIRLGAQINSPGVIFHELGTHKRPDGSRQALVLTTCCELWDGRLPAWDAPVFTMRLYAGFPRALGLLPFDPVQALADARTAEAIVGGHEAERRDDVFYIAGEPLGRRMPFSAFCKQHDLKLPDYGQPDPLVSVMERDWMCPRRKRVVLSSGCAYGAPGYIFKLHWRVPRDRSRNYLQHLLDEAFHPEHVAEDARVQALAEAFVGAAEPPISCRYVASEGALYENGQYLCKGVPALILLRCLRAHVSEGQEAFTYRAFKHDTQLISHPKNTGFEVRLKRLRETLIHVDSGLRIEPTGPGRFRLRSRGPILLAEV